MSLTWKIDQLTSANSYPHPVEVITTIETHISVIFLTGQFAYKLKKPVNFGFLDFSTLANRQRFCEKEVVLNKRTAPDIYLACLPVYQHQDGLSFQPESPEQLPIEYLVKMKQFDPNLVLGRYLTGNTLNNEQIEQLANSLANFHLNTISVPPESPYGHPDDIVHPMLDNFPSMLSSFDDADNTYRLKQLANWTHLTQVGLFETLLERKQQGFVKQCHGDMHLDNIALIDGNPTLFDGIEFNDQFSWIDVMSDLAFLLIDLDHRKQATLKNTLLSRYLSITGDFNGLKLLKFYQTYRAMVRAKITDLRYYQLAADSLEASQCRTRAYDYFKQAESYAYDLPEPKLILLQGLSGSGKSFYAEEIIKHQGGIIISSDIERKRLYGISPLTRVAEADKAMLYSAEMNGQTYARLLQLAEWVLKQGYSVVMDATFLRRNSREPFIELAEKLSVDYKIFSILPNIALIKQNITDRTERNDNPSDANFEVALRQHQSLESPGVDEDCWQIEQNTALNLDILKNWLAQPL